MNLLDAAGSMADVKLARMWRSARHAANHHSSFVSSCRSIHALTALRGSGSGRQSLPAAWPCDGLATGPKTAPFPTRPQPRPICLQTNTSPVLLLLYSHHSPLRQDPLVPPELPTAALPPCPCLPAIPHRRPGIQGHPCLVVLLLCCRLSIVSTALCVGLGPIRPSLASSPSTASATSQITRQQQDSPVPRLSCRRPSPSPCPGSGFGSGFGFGSLATRRNTATPRHHDITPPVRRAGRHSAPPLRQPLSIPPSCLLQFSFPGPSRTTSVPILLDGALPTKISIWVTRRLVGGGDLVASFRSTKSH